MELQEAVDRMELSRAAYQKAALQTSGDVEAAAIQAAKLAAAAAVVEADTGTQRGGAVAFNLALDDLLGAIGEARIPIEAAPPPAA